jgi:DNA uptake protein ComE-like DNA-binding protein
MKRFPVLALASALTLALAAPALSQAAGHGGKSTAATASASKEHAAHKAKSAAHRERIDINSASKEQLMALPGMDDAMADKIIAGRPFKAKSDLLHKSILTKAEYSKVSTHIIAKQEAKAAPESKAPESSPGDQGQASQQGTPESK